MDHDNNNNNEVQHLCNLLEPYLKAFRLPYRPDFQRGEMGPPVFHVVIEMLGYVEEEISLEVLTLILKFGQDVNVRDRHGLTALHHLVARLDEDNGEITSLVFDLLLAHRADPTAKDFEGGTVLLFLLS